MNRQHRHILTRSINIILIIIEIYEIEPNAVILHEKHRKIK